LCDTITRIIEASKIDKLSVPGKKSVAAVVCAAANRLPGLGVAKLAQRKQCRDNELFHLVEYGSCNDNIKQIDAAGQELVAEKAEHIRTNKFGEQFILYLLCTAKYF
jgi:hypothetical protein